MAGLRIGSLCSGYRGLDMAVEEVFGASTTWVSDIDPGANKILAHHWPDTPNIGDLTTTQWEDVEPVDIVCGGYPCQPFSVAGRRKGTEDERHIWPYIADALRVLRPRYAVFENVAGHLRIGFDDVLADLAGLGFDVEWCTVRASEVGAPHRRERLFILARAADADGPGLEGGRVRGAVAECGPAAENAYGTAGGQRRLTAPGQAEGGRARPDAGGRGGASAADADGPAGRLDLAGGGPCPVQGSEVAERQAQQPGRLRGSGGGEGAVAWGAFGPAVRRWEHATGRPAPWATDDRNRLSPLFVEWMMGLPAGHVTEVPDMSRNEQLKALGNGVVSQQAAAALRLLLERSTAHQLAA